MSEQSKDPAAALLELDVVLAHVADLALSPTGRMAVKRLPFITQSDDLKQEITRVTEARDLLRFDDPFPLQHFPDLQPVLKRAAVSGTFLEPQDLLTLGRFLAMCRRIKTYLSSRENKAPSLLSAIRHIIPLPELEKEIDRIIDPGGEVKDKASPELSQIRRELARQSNRIQKQLETILRNMTAKGYVQEEALVLREGRLVIPMKEGHRGRLKGVVVDQSASGATLFVEPLEVFEINNVVRRLRRQEKQEIEKILTVLTDEVRRHRLGIEAQLDAATRLDAIMARASFSLQIDGNPARTDEERILNLRNARHPLLILKKGEDAVVPLDLKIDQDLKTVVITGPNAGGKTVTLKTVGLLVLMHQHGMHIPAAEESSLPLFSRVFADIGDRQSIEQDLSTFSSHVASIHMILSHADDQSLVLIDEIGSATDPAEGSALAETVLRRLTRSGCLTVATTHMGALKVFAHDEPGVENGSMIFDQEKLTPTYRFQMGIPGSSYAFEIAQRLGLDPAVVQDARSLVGEERGKLDSLILQLEQDLARSHKLAEAADIEKSRLSGLVELYQSSIDRIRDEGELRIQSLTEEAEDLFRQANAEIENVVREIRESQADQAVVRQVKERIQTQRKRARNLTKKSPQSKTADLHPGDWVCWPGHEGQGQVLSEPDKDRRVLVRWNEFKLKLPTSELEAGQAPAKPPSKSGLSRYTATPNVRDEIDLRGLTAHEAIEAVDRYLGDASRAGLSTVRIIHGKGTGVLRREVSAYLQGHPLAKTQRLGNWNEGDTGVTVVELA